MIDEYRCDRDGGEDDPEPNFEMRKAASENHVTVDIQMNDQDFTAE